MTVNTNKYIGCGVALVTPFTPAGEIDYKALSTHTDRLISKGISYLVVLGTTAETPTLDAGEKDGVIRCVVEASNGRVPVIVGAGINSTRAVIDCIKGLDKQGVDGLLSVVPYYNKPSQEGIYQHFSAIAAVSELPVILYNVPGRTGSNMTAETALRLANDYPEVIRGLKEASGNFDQISSMLRQKPASFALLSGDDALTLPMMAMGAEGVISVIGNAYPELFSELVVAARESSWEKARELHFRLYPMMQAIFREGNPSGIKAAMEIRAWGNNVVRLPLVAASAELSDDIRKIHGVLS